MTAVLATFHTTLLVLVVLTLVYFLGDLGDGLDDLNTFVGLGLFAYLWVLVWFATAGALDRLRWPEQASYAATVEAAMYGGGQVGAALVVMTAALAAGAFVVGGVATLDTDLFFAVLFVVPIAAIGGLVAFSVGAIVGIAFGALDSLLVSLSGRVLDSASPPQLNADS